MKALEIKDIGNWFKPVLKQNPFLETLFEGIFGKKDPQKEMAQTLAEINKETKEILRLMGEGNYKSCANNVNKKLSQRTNSAERSL